MNLLQFASGEGVLKIHSIQFLILVNTASVLLLDILPLQMVWFWRKVRIWKLFEDNWSKFRLVFVLFTLTCTVSCEVCGATRRESQN